MFPPVSEIVLQDNPDFANLYGKLTKVLLNPDGSTKDDPARNEREAIRKELQQHRLETAKQHLLTQAIATATPPEQKSQAPARLPRARSAKDKDDVNLQELSSQQKEPSPNSLPDPLLDLLIILPSLLDLEDPPPPESTSILLSSPPLSDLEILLPDLTALISSTLHSSALNLARIANPSTNPSYLHRQIPSLPHSLTTLHTAQASAQQTLAKSRLETLAALSTALDSHSHCLTLLIRCLEAKHGVVARNLELRASDASLSAQRIAADADIALKTLRRDIYSPHMVHALRNYAAHLQDARVRGAERIRGLEVMLGEYGVGVEGGRAKERTMREMASKYREMERQLKDAEADLERLRDE